MSVFDQPTSSYPSFPATATTPEFLPTPSQQQAFPSDPFTPIQPVQQQPTANNDSSNYEPVVDEKPLLEELGINFYDIMKRSILVLNPFNKSNSHLLEEKDLSGPLFFCLSLYVYYILLHCRGVILLLRAKELRFGYIYGFGLLDCIFIYFLLNVMRKENTEMHRVASILGYGLLPILGLSAISLFVASHHSILPLIMLLLVIYSTLISTNLFCIALDIKEKTWLLGYPLFLVYFTFALLTIF